VGDPAGHVDRHEAKNTARAFALFALANLYLSQYRLLPAGATCRL
jgi:hypothetical protein